MAIHRECQQRMMCRTPAHASQCAICQCPYRNVTHTLRFMQPLEQESEGEDDTLLAELNIILLVLIFHVLGAVMGCNVCRIFWPAIAGAYSLMCLRLFPVRFVPVVNSDGAAEPKIRNYVHSSLASRLVPLLH